MVQQLIRVCGQQGVELKSWPFDSIARIVRPDETQRSALEQLRTTANQTADTLASDCPQDTPTAPSDQLEAAERGLETAIAALKAVQPAITTFYTSLDDEQKARLVARHLAASASQESVRRSRSRAYGSSDRDLSPPQWDSICEQWAAALRDWPISRIERTIRLTETQRVALYDVVASSLKAAGTLMTSCPTEIALTPAARMETLRKRLEAVRRATEAIHPALAQFYETLDNNQKTRFAEMN